MLTLLLASTRLLISRVTAKTPILTLAFNNKYRNSVNAQPNKIMAKVGIVARVKTLLFTKYIPFFLLYRLCDVVRKKQTAPSL